MNTQELLKRQFDFWCALIGLIIIFPLFLILAVLIKINSPGPVFFRQERLGKDNKIFRIWKLRTMLVGSDKLNLSIQEISKKWNTPIRDWGIIIGQLTIYFDDRLKKIKSA